MTDLEGDLGSEPASAST